MFAKVLKGMGGGRQGVAGREDPHGFVGLTLLRARSILIFFFVKAQMSN